ncbi:hypothetical protein BCY84_05373 [Trypanosoma cruzi cruzi]|nr:hypothetical protein BCY84_05373 [Trypanosoma cruzi cruzi]
MDLESSIQREGLPREVLVWLRTLQLPRVVRHPKRDFSNGFLVAAICSRYWSSVSMHSYEDRMSAAQKRSNWELLQKQFALNNCPLSERMINGMIACREEYANSFLRQLYEHLTGRMIVEAAPLTAAEVSQPRTFLPQSVPPAPSRKISVDFVTPSADTPKRTASRVRELRSSNLMVLARSESNSSVPVAKNYVIHAIAGEQMSPDKNADDTEEEKEEKGGSDSDGEKKKQRGEQKVEFFVSLRPAEVQQTVVRAAHQGSGQNAARDEKKRQQRQQQKQQQSDEMQSGTCDATALDTIESIVRKQAAGQGWICVRDEPTAFTNYFLFEENNLGALLHCRLWSTLLGSVSDLTDRILRHGGFMADIAALFLQRPLPEETINQQRHQLQVDNGFTTPKLWKKMASPRGTSGSKRFVFLASLLSSISDVDKFLAVSMYYDDILPHSAEAMRTLDRVTADEYASLLCAALPSDRKTAARLLPDMLLATDNSITVSNTFEAKRSYYLFLRAVLLRLSRNERCGSLRNKRYSCSAATTTTTTTTTTAHDPLLLAAFEIIGHNCVSALTHESSTVRLVGVYLAEALAFAGCSTVSLFMDILPFLSACMKLASPLFKCVCAAWMRTAMKRLCNPFGDEKRETEVREVYDEEVSAYAGPYLSTIMQHLYDVLVTPGRLKVRAYIAEQLALCLHDIPDVENMRRLFNPEKLAVAIFSVFQTTPPELVASFIKPPSPADGRVSAGGEYNGQMSSGGVSCPLLGPLLVDGSLLDCYPLALAEAILTVFPLEAGGPKLTPTRETAAPLPMGNRGTNSPDGMAMTSRQIMTKANLMLRERMVPVDVAQRVTWMYKLIVASRSGCGFPKRPASLSETAATKRWNAVMRQMYRDIAVLSAAAEMLCTQKGALTDNAANAIAQMAGMAQQIVLRWHTELKNDGASPPRPLVSSSVTSSERMLLAMEWYHNSFGAMTPKEQQKQQQQQQNRIPAAPSRN